MKILRLLVMAMLAGAGLSACGPKSDVTIVPPKVPQGGRAVAITVSLSDAKRLVVATESGGLFRTFDGGVSFQHLDGFPTLYAIDVVKASLDHNVLIATARDDFAATTGGGIWRSADGGVTWTRPCDADGRGPDRCDECTCEVGWNFRREGPGPPPTRLGGGECGAARWLADDDCDDEPAGRG